MEQTYLDEKNAIASSGAWIWLVEIELGGLLTPLRRASNNTTVTWGGYEWRPMPITIEDVSESTSGEFREYRVSVGDVDLAGSLRTYVTQKAGLIGNTIRFVVVHSAHLDVGVGAVDEVATITECEVTAQAVVFSVGFPDRLNCRFPRDRYVPGFCRHKFGGGLCKYSGVATACNHTLAECRERNNSVNFGGSPGIVGGVYG